MAQTGPSVVDTSPARCTRTGRASAPGVGRPSDPGSPHRRIHLPIHFGHRWCPSGQDRTPSSPGSRSQLPPGDGVRSAALSRCSQGPSGKRGRNADVRPTRSTTCPWSGDATAFQRGAPPRLAVSRPLVGKLTPAPHDRVARGSTTGDHRDRFLGKKCKEVWILT